MSQAEELIAKAKAVFASARIWIAYNGSFDLRFLSYWGIRPEKDTVVIDVMKDFAEVYKERDSYHGGYRWKKLTFAADYYGYTWPNSSAHDSCADCRATLYVHQHIKAGAKQAPTGSVESARSDNPTSYMNPSENQEVQEVLPFD